MKLDFKLTHFTHKSFVHFDILFISNISNYNFLTTAVSSLTWSQERKKKNKMCVSFLQNTGHC